MQGTVGNNDAATAAGTGVGEWDARVSLVEAMAEKDINVDINDVIIDGKLHRIYVEGDDKGTKNGFYTAFFDETPAGNFGCNKRYGYDVKHPWSMKVKRAPMSAEEKRAYREKMDADRARRAAEESARDAAAAALANRIWDAATHVEGDDHPYLKRKGIQSYGLRVGTWEKVDQNTGEVSIISKNALLIPIWAPGKKIHSLQAILPDAKKLGRDKDYLSGANKHGHYFSIGKPIEHEGKQVILLVEGYATGASLHAATGHAVIVAFDAPNLLPVAELMRHNFPDATIVVAGDNDQWTLRPVKNPGLMRANEVRDAVDALVAMPQFDAALGVANATGKIKGPNDFNDLARLEGDDAVRAVIANTLIPPAVAEHDALAGALQVEDEELIDFAADGAMGSNDDEKLADVFVLSVKNMVPATLAVDLPQEILEQHAVTPITPRVTREMKEHAVAGLPGADARDGMFGCPLTEVGNAERLFGFHGNNLRYCPDTKAWLHWENGCWLWDLDGSKLRQLAADLSLSIYDEGRNYLHQAEHFIKWARKSGEKRTIESATKLLADRHELRIPLAHIDGDKFVMGIDDGRQVVDLRTGRVRLAQQSDMITKSAGVRGVGDESKAVRWKKFLDEVFLGDQQMIDWLQRFLGYSLTGSTREQFFMFGFGGGSNGKGVLASVMREVWADYYRTISSDTLMEQRRSSGAATPELAKLVGARLIISGETERGCALSEALVKLVTGEEEISCRHLYGPEFEYLPQFKLFMAGNYKPTIRGTDNGIWRRVRLVPFNRKFEEHEMDKGLGAKLIEEREHIFAWILAGCLKWQERGLCDRPGAVERATREYRAKEDVIGEWLCEICSFGPDNTTGARDLFSKYQVWALANGYRPMSEKNFRENMLERDGITVTRRAAGNQYKGIAVLF
ncbi:P4 family phage/plasmid primase-like protein [Paraburkholderia sp. UCT70]|uniref:phage/plasmid primase, P4 family n=1 Tax=Paraburkholderia sp. UCT70 TaxID=2991068 RepID=UPI003D1BFF1B